MNHYQILDLPQSASRQDIRERFHTLSRALHTDRQSNTGHLFSAVKDAYDTLMDETRRKQYDKTLQKLDNNPRQLQPVSDYFDTLVPFNMFNGSDMFNAFNMSFKSPTDSELTERSKHGHILVSEYRNIDGRESKRIREYDKGRRVNRW